MPAAAWQKAPETKPKTAGAPIKQEKHAGMKEKLHRLPQTAGVAIMIVLLALALVAGNFRALDIATPKAFIRQGDVTSIIEDRIDAAQNVLTIAERAFLSESAIVAAKTAAGQLERAKTAREISRADQALAAAVSELVTAENLGQDTAYMQRAADSFSEQGSFLRQEARSYNEKAQKAEDLYEKLPLRFMLPQPDLYEGL